MNYDLGHNHIQQKLPKKPYNKINKFKYYLTQFYLIKRPTTRKSSQNNIVHDPYVCALYVRYKVGVPIMTQVNIMINIT